MSRQPFTVALDELLGMDAYGVVVDGNRRPGHDQREQTNERDPIGVQLTIRATRILTERNKKQ